MIQRHRMVNSTLKDEMTPGKIHALSIQAKTVAQWEAAPEIATTPNCLGGDK